MWNGKGSNKTTKLDSVFITWNFVRCILIEVYEKYIEKAKYLTYNNINQTSTDFYKSVVL